MFLVLWEFDVKPGCKNRFELMYGPDGDWVRLFRVDSNYQGTRLLHDASRKNLYLTLDAWRSRTSYDAFLQSHRAEYDTLDVLCEGLTLNERRVGTFEGPAPL
jgi:hypothetical protein